MRRVDMDIDLMPAAAPEPVMPGDDDEQHCDDDNQRSDDKIEPAAPA